MPTPYLNVPLPLPSSTQAIANAMVQHEDSLELQSRAVWVLYKLAMHSTSVEAKVYGTYLSPFPCPRDVYSCMSLLGVQLSNAIPSSPSLLYHSA